MIIAHSESVGTLVATRDVTVKTALAGAALLPLSVTKPPAATVLVRLPAEAAVTSTLTVQEPAAAGLRVAIGIVPPVKVTVLPPAEAVTVLPQVLLAFGVAAISMPLGKLSVSEVMVSAASTLELNSVTVRVDVPPALIVVGLKLLLTVGTTGPVTRGALSAHPRMLFVGPAVVTAAVSDTALPFRLPLPMMTLPAPAAPAMTVPGKLTPLRVAVLPTRQNTWQGSTPIKVTVDKTLAVSESGTRKM
jgi:hypothetical protein